MINPVTIAGDIGKKPDLIPYDSGKYKVSFSRAINKVINGDLPVKWIPVESWDNRANFVNNYLKSGSDIVASVRREYSSEEDEGGKKKYLIYVVDNLVESPQQKEKGEREND